MDTEPHLRVVLRVIETLQPQLEWGRVYLFLTLHLRSFIRKIKAFSIRQYKCFEFPMKVVAYWPFGQILLLAVLFWGLFLQESAKPVSFLEFRGIFVRPFIAECFL